MIPKSPKTLFALFFIFLLPYTSSAIGVRAHIEIGLDAVNKYIKPWNEQCPGLSKLFEYKDVYPAFYAGCAFPDWGYGGINPDCAEASHWNKFMSAYVDILKQKLPILPPSDARKELAFFLGMVVHNISDIPWHFDEHSHRSFLTSAREEGGTSHRDAEFSTDIFLFNESKAEPPIPMELFWPYETVLQCFKQVNMNVTAEQIKAGCTREQAYLTTGPFLALTQYESMKQNYPWVYKHYRDYYYGGLDHNSSVVSTFMKHYFALITGNFFTQRSPTYSPYVRRSNDYIPITGILDTTLIEDRPENNTGMEPLLFVGKQQGKEQKILFQFAIPTFFQNKQLKRASLYLFIEQIEHSAGKNTCLLKVQRITTPWEEGTAMTNESNEEKERPTSGVSWLTQPEVDVNSTFRLEIPLSPKWIELDVTDFTKFWIENPQANYGICISIDESIDHDCTLSLFSSEAFQENNTGFCGGKRIAYRPLIFLESKDSLTPYLFSDNK